MNITAQSTVAILSTLLDETDFSASSGGLIKSPTVGFYRVRKRGEQHVILWWEGADTSNSANARLVGTADDSAAAVRLMQRHAKLMGAALLIYATGRAIHRSNGMDILSGTASYSLQSRGGAVYVKRYVDTTGADDYPQKRLTARDAIWRFASMTDATTFVQQDIRARFYAMLNGQLRRPSDARLAGVAARTLTTLATRGTSAAVMGAVAAVGAGAAGAVGQWAIANGMTLNTAAALAFFATATVGGVISTSDLVRRLKSALQLSDDELAAAVQTPCVGSEVAADLGSPVQVFRPDPAFQAKVHSDQLTDFRESGAGALVVERNGQLEIRRYGGGPVSVFDLHWEDRSEHLRPKALSSVSWATRVERPEPGKTYDLGPNGRLVVSDTGVEAHFGRRPADSTLIMPDQQESHSRTHMFVHNGDERLPEVLIASMDGPGGISQPAVLAELLDVHGGAVEVEFFSSQEAALMWARDRVGASRMQIVRPQQSYRYSSSAPYSEEDQDYDLTV